MIIGTLVACIIMLLFIFLLIKRKQKKKSIKRRFTEKVLNNYVDAIIEKIDGMENHYDVFFETYSYDDSGKREVRIKEYQCFFWGGNCRGACIDFTRDLGFEKLKAYRAPVTLMTISKKEVIEWFGEVLMKKLSEKYPQITLWGHYFVKDSEFNGRENCWIFTYTIPEKKVKSFY